MYLLLKEELQARMEEKMQESRTFGQQLEPIQAEIEEQADGGGELTDKVPPHPQYSQSPKLKELEAILTRVSSAKRNLDVGKEKRKVMKVKFTAEIEACRQHLQTLEEELEVNR